MNLKVGIDLLWVRPRKVGGTESYIRNLLDGFMEYLQEGVHFVLFVSKDNWQTFQKYKGLKNFELVKCNVKSQNVFKRILWENLNIDKLAKYLQMDIMFIPVYSKPKSDEKIPYVVTIHDLQALHFPQYFSKTKNWWLRKAWKRTARTATRIVAISHFVKRDIVEKLGVPEEKINVIYNPILLSNKEKDFNALSSKYGIKKEEYFYTVSSMAPHKNLLTLIELLHRIKMNPVDDVPAKLVISGIGGDQSGKLLSEIEEKGLKEDIVITGYISNEERDCLYKNAFCFLFPSTFEGFGMPPIEAMRVGTPVLTTRCASIPEVTKGKAIYVTNPFDIEEWYEKVKLVRTANREPLDFSEYDIRIIVNDYIKLFASLVDNHSKYRG